MARYQQKTILNFGNSVDVATNQVQRQWQQVGQISDKIGGVAQRFLESETKRKASIAGMVDGQKHEGGLQTGLSSYTTYGQQYNESYVAAYGADIALEANQKINEFAVDANTPGEFIQMVGGYRKGLMAGVSDPVLQGLADSKINQYVAAPYKAMLKAQQERELEKAETSHKKGMLRMSTDGVSAWRGAETEDELKAAAVAENEFFAVLNARVNSDDPMLQISVETADEMTNTYNAQKAEALITGSSFTREIENGRGYEYIQEFRNKINPTDYGLTTEEHSKLITKMDKQLTAHLKYMDRLDDEADDAHELEQSQNNIKFLLNPDSLTDDALNTALENGDITEKSYNSLVKLMDEGEAESNEQAVSELWRDLALTGPEGIEERVNEMVKDGDINHTDLTQIMTALESGKFNDPTKRMAYSTAESILSQTFGESDKFGFLSKDSKYKVADKRLELYGRVLKGEDAMTVLREMVAAERAKSARLSEPAHWAGDYKGSLTAAMRALQSRYPGQSLEWIQKTLKSEIETIEKELAAYAKQEQVGLAMESTNGK